MSVPDNLRPTHSEKTKNAMKAPRIVNRVTFAPTEANPDDTPYVFVPKLGQNRVIVPNSLALIFDIDLSEGHANNYLVQNVSRALVERFVVRFSDETIEDTNNYDIYKIFQDLFLPGEKRDNMVHERIQSEDLCKIRSGAGDAKTSGVDAEKKLAEVYGKKYRINLEHQILTDHGVFYPNALNNFVFELKLAPANQVVRGSDPTKLKYKLRNIHLEYEMIQSEELANEAAQVYHSGKEFAYDHVSRSAEVVKFSKEKDAEINIKVNPQRRSIKSLLLLFIEPYTGGARDSEKYVFPDLKKIKVTINGVPNMLYNGGIESRDTWSEVSRFFMKEKHKPQHMTLEKFFTKNKFGLLIDLRSMASQEMHGSGTRLVNSTDGIQLEIEREKKGTGKVNYYVYIISDCQLNIQNKQLDSVQK